MSSKNKEKVPSASRTIYMAQPALDRKDSVSFIPVIDSKVPDVEFLMWW